MQGGVYKRRLSKCFHTASSCFRTPLHSTSCHRLSLFTSPIIPTPSIFPRKTLSENSSRLRNFRKHCTKLLFACGTSARITQNCIQFSELPQILYKNVFFLRNFRKDYTKLHVTCGTSANIAQKCILLAELPQMACNLRIHLIIL